MRFRQLLALGAGVAVTALSLQAGATTIQSISPTITVNSFNTGTAGALLTPWLINETMTGAGTLRIVDEGPPLAPGNPTNSGHTTAKWFQKTILNNSGETWTSFELELQVLLGTPSGEGDGLSFADGSPLALTFFSNQFATYTRIDVLRDYLNFSSGDVLPGESVTFTFIISDNLANNPFFLLQTPNKRDVIPEPGALSLFGLALLALVAARRFKARA